jgi:hypothetical protein
MARRKKREAYVSSPGIRKRSTASYAKKPSTTSKKPSMIATATAAGRSLVNAVHNNKTVSTIYRAGVRALGVDLGNLAARTGTVLGEMTSRQIRKKLDNLMKTDSPEAVFMPRAHGLSDSDAGTVATYACAGMQTVAGRDIRRIAAGKKISAMYDTEMQAAAKMFKETSVITSVMGSQFRGQVHYESGFNCKGYVEPVSQFIVLDSTSGSNPTPKIARGENENANNYTMFFQTQDYYNVIAQSAGVLPILNLTNVTDSNDTDLFFAIRSLKLEVDIMNSNAYYPCQVKIYVLRAKTDLGVSNPPVHQYFGTSVTTQSVDRVNVGYLKYKTTTTLASGDTSPIDYDYTSEFSVLPQVTPAMSPAFKADYDIISVDKITLNPLDSIEYILEKEIPHPTSFRQVNRYREESIAVKAGDYGLMIEFQGANGIAVPNRCISKDYAKADVTINEPVIGLVPTRLRVDTKKTSVISAQAIDSTLNPTEALSSVNTTWLNERNFAPSVDTEVTTFSYAQLEQGTTTPSSLKYALPVYTDESKSAGGSISGD